MQYDYPHRKAPRGEAPEDVRDAWIGLLLPVLPRYPRLVEGHGLGVLSAPRSWLARRIKTLFARGPRTRGYVVDSAAAVELLENVNPRAAAWWRTNTPYLLKPGRYLLFEEECRVVEDSAAAG